MNKKSKAKQLTSAELYGVHQDFLGLLARVNLPFNLFFLYMTYKNEFSADKDLLQVVFSTGVIISIISLLLSWFKGVVQKYQSGVYVLISLESLVMMLTFDFLNLGLFSMEDGHIPDDLLGAYLWNFIIPLTIIFLLSLIFFYFYHKNKTVAKLNHYFNNGNYQKTTVSIPLIFLFVMVGRVFFKGNASVAKIFGIIIAILLTATLPAGIMGGLFSAAYIRKYPDRREIK